MLMMLSLIHCCAAAPADADAGDDDDDVTYDAINNTAECFHRRIMTSLSVVAGRHKVAYLGFSFGEGSFLLSHPVLSPPRSY